MMEEERERRSSGRDRRSAIQAMEYNGRERRVSDRRQVSVQEISFREWATHLVHFKQRMVLRQKRRAEREARKLEEKLAQTKARAAAASKPKA